MLRLALGPQDPVFFLSVVLLSSHVCLDTYSTRNDSPVAMAFLFDELAFSRPESAGALANNLRVMYNLIRPYC